MTLPIVMAPPVRLNGHMHSHRDPTNSTKAATYEVEQINTLPMRSRAELRLVRSRTRPPPTAEWCRVGDESYNGPKVDIWALGVLLHFMLIGVTPFRGETVPELKSAILQGSFSLPLYLEHSSRMLIESMLAKDPFKRPKIDDVRKSIWLRGSRFPSTYVNLRTCQESEEEARSEVAKKVWAIMNSYGITEQMLEDSNERGPRNALIGTYRIVQYQVQTAVKEQVWAIMNSYGITEQMLEDSNERGPRNALIGTYRIVQYQVQTAVKEQVRHFINWSEMFQKQFLIRKRLSYHSVITRVVGYHAPISR
ncbi:hypothetical protein COOONC_09793 [Cooperia oncophora]